MTVAFERAQYRLSPPRLSIGAYWDGGAAY